MGGRRVRWQLVDGLRGRLVVAVPSSVEVGLRKVSRARGVPFGMLVNGLLLAGMVAKGWVVGVEGDLDEIKPLRRGVLLRSNGGSYRLNPLAGWSVYSRVGAYFAERVGCEVGVRELLAEFRKDERDSVRMALSRLCNAGQLRRVGHGVYVRDGGETSP